MSTGTSILWCSWATSVIVSKEWIEKKRFYTQWKGLGRDCGPGSSKAPCMRLGFTVFPATVPWLVLREKRTGGLLFCQEPPRWDGWRAHESLRAGIRVECWCQAPAFQKWETDCCNCAGKEVLFSSNVIHKGRQHMVFLLTVYQLLCVAQNHEKQSKF